MFLSIDLPIFRIINNLAGKSIYLDSIAIFLARDLIYFLPLFIILVYFFQQKNKFLKIILLTLCSGAIVFLVEFLFKRFHFRSRPFAFLGFTPLIKFSPEEAALPSLHTALAFSIAFVIYFMNRKIGWLCIFFAILIGLSRIYVGVHWPTDILAGFILGFSSFFIIKNILKNINP